MVGFIVEIEFHINSCTCALFVLDLRCSAKKMKVPTITAYDADFPKAWTVTYEADGVTEEFDAQGSAG